MNTLKKQFSDALKREGKIITTYYKNESVTCLFRKNSDNNSTDEHLTIFYDITTPIKQGQLLSYGGKTYITLNQESVENDTYYKSSLLECNLLLPIPVNGVIEYIPCYSYDLTSPYVIEGQVLTLLDGKGEIITETTTLTADLKSIPLGTKFNILGGWFEYQNMYTKSGISHLLIERTAEPSHTYTFDLTSDASQYETGTNTTLVSSPKVDGVIDTTATITYISSDETIATVDSNGTVSFLAQGSVIITATWVEQNLTDTVALTVIAGEVPLTYTVTINTDATDDNTKIGLTYNHSAVFTDNLGNVITPTSPVFTLDTNYNGLITLTDNGNGTCTTKVKSDAYDLLTKQFTLTCMDMYSGFSGSKTYTIIGLF